VFESVPDVPHPHDLLSVNATSATVRLSAFSDGGCPVQYFVVEHRRADAIGARFKTVANDVSPREGDFHIRGLEPATRYFIRVSAHNSAGSSVAEYPFATLTARGATLPPPRSNTREDSLRPSIGRGGNDDGRPGTGFKVFLILLTAAATAAGAFYAVVSARRWKKRRGK